MAKKKEEDGVWRTIGGRHIFIRNGESVEDAMKNSGKFPSAKSKNGEVKEVESATKKDNKLGDYVDLGADMNKVKKKQKEIDEMEKKWNTDENATWEQYDKQVKAGEDFTKEILSKNKEKPKTGLEIDEDEFNNKINDLKEKFLNEDDPAKAEEFGKQLDQVENEYRNKRKSIDPIGYEKELKNIQQKMDKADYDKTLAEQVRNEKGGSAKDKIRKMSLTDTQRKAGWKTDEDFVDYVYNKYGDNVNSKDIDTAKDEYYKAFGQEVENVSDKAKANGEKYFNVDDARANTRNKFGISAKTEYGTKKELKEKYPNEWKNGNYDTYADDDYMAMDFSDDGKFKGIRLSSKEEANKMPKSNKNYRQIEKQLLDDYSKVDTEDLETYRDIFKEQGKNKFAGRLQGELDKRKSGPSKEQRAKMHQLAEQVRNEKGGKGRKINYQKGYGENGTVYDQSVHISNAERDAINKAIDEEIKNGYPNHEKYANDLASAKLNLKSIGNDTYHDSNKTTNSFIKNHLGDDKIKTDRNTRYIIDDERSLDQIPKKKVGEFKLENGKRTYSERELGDDERGYWTKENGSRVFKENPRYNKTQETPKINEYSDMQKRQEERIAQIDKEAMEYQRKKHGQKGVDEYKKYMSQGDDTFTKATNEKPKSARQTMNDGVDDEIKQRFGTDGGYDDDDYQKNLKEQIDYMRNPGESIQQTAERLVKGGDFRIYTGDQEDYLRENGVKFTEDDDVMDLYAKHMGSKIAKLYNQKPKYKGNMKPQYDSRKSFYGKANSTENRDGSKTLTSYDTDIMNIKNGKIKMLCEKKDLTNTTLRHIKEFLQQNGLDAMKKKDLVELIEKGESKTLDAVKDARSSMKSDQAYKNAYQQYLKEHPSSNMSFEEFKKMIR